MKTIEITIGERVVAINILNAGKFDNRQLAYVLEDIKKLAVTPEEWEQSNLKKTPSDEELNGLSAEERAKTPQTWKWDETVTKQVELSQETVDYLKGAIKQKSDAKELTLQDAAVVTLDKKL
jgi:hypothetical protein